MWFSKFKEVGIGSDKRSLGLYVVKARIPRLTMKEVSRILTCNFYLHTLHCVVCPTVTPGVSFEVVVGVTKTCNSKD